MDFAQLIYFKTVVEEKNLTYSAKKLHITQPALSKSLSRLSDELGFPLFEYQGRRIIPNQNGLLLYSWVTDTMNNYYEMLGKIKSDSSQLATALKMASSGVQMSSLVLVDFQRLYPDISVDTVLFNCNDFPNIIFRDDIDGVLSCQNFNHPDVESMLIYEEPLLLVLSKSHPLAKKESLRLADVKGEKFILSPTDNLYRSTLNKIFQQAGFQPEVRASVPSTHRLALVSNGVGITVWTQSAVHYYAAPDNCCTIPLEDPFCMRSIYLLWCRNHRNSSSFNVYLDYLKTHQLTT